MLFCNLLAYTLYCWLEISPHHLCCPQAQSSCYRKKHWRQHTEIITHSKRRTQLKRDGELSLSPIEGLPCLWEDVWSDLFKADCETGSEAAVFWPIFTLGCWFSVSLFLINTQFQSPQSGNSILFGFVGCLRSADNTFCHLTVWDTSPHNAKLLRLWGICLSSAGVRLLTPSATPGTQDYFVVQRLEHLTVAYPLLEPSHRQKVVHGKDMRVAYQEESYPSPISSCPDSN